MTWETEWPWESPPSWPSCFFLDLSMVTCLKSATQRLLTGIYWCHSVLYFWPWLNVRSCFSLNRAPNRTRSRLNLRYVTNPISSCYHCSSFSDQGVLSIDLFFFNVWRKGGGEQTPSTFALNYTCKPATGTTYTAKKIRCETYPTWWNFVRTAYTIICIDLFSDLQSVDCF